MWNLMSKQLIAGMGAPRATQLASIYDRYTDPKKGCLTKGDLALAMKDYSEARVLEISTHELPELETAMARQTSTNQFVHLLTRAWSLLTS